MPHSAPEQPPRGPDKLQYSLASDLSFSECKLRLPPPCQTGASRLLGSLKWRRFARRRRRRRRRNGGGRGTAQCGVHGPVVVIAPLSVLNVAPPAGAPPKGAGSFSCAPAIVLHPPPFHHPRVSLEPPPQSSSSVISLGQVLVGRALL